MKAFFSIVLMVLSFTFFAKDALTAENSIDTKIVKDYFLSVDELTQPREFIGTLAIQKTKNDDKYYELITEENGREVAQVLNNKNDSFYANNDHAFFENMQNTLKLWLARKLKLWGSLFPG